jgi:DHA2 family multidrug resistance protein
MKNKPIIIALFVLLYIAIGLYTLPNMMAVYIVGDLGGSNDIATYVVSFYGLGNALGLVLGRQILSRFGMSKSILFLLILLTISHWLCATSPTYFLFLLYRVFQGIICGPFFILIFHMFSLIIPQEKKATTTSIIITLFTIVPVISACWGALLAYNYLWQWAYYINIPIALFLAAFLYPRLKPFDERTQKPSFNWVGYIFYSIGLTFLFLALVTGQQLDWFRSPLIIAFLLIGTTSFGFYLLQDYSHPFPVLELKLLKKPAFSFAMVNIAVLFAAYFAMIILLALWLNLYASYTPIWIGILLGAMAITGVFPVILFRHRFFSNTDTRIPLAIAITFFAISCIHTMNFNIDIDMGRIAVSRLIAGLGLAFFLPPLFRLAFRNFPEEKASIILIFFQVFRAIGSGLGVAVFTTIWQRRRVFFHERLGENLTPFSEEVKDFFLRAKEFQLQDLKASEQLEIYLDRQSTSLALNDCFYLMAIILIVLMLVLCATLLLKTEPFFPEKQKANQ